MPPHDIDLYSDEEDNQDPSRRQDEDDREDPLQESVLSHFAEMYVLQRDNSYILRELHLQSIRHSETMRRIRLSTQQKIMELAKLRRSRIQRERAEHVRNRRRRDSILGNFHVYRKLTGQIENEADVETRVDPWELLCDFWSLTG